MITDVSNIRTIYFITLFPHFQSFGEKRHLVEAHGISMAFSMAFLEKSTSLYMQSVIY